MQNNRKILISTANSRWASVWQPLSLLWSEFVESLRTPKRTTERLDQFLSYKKRQQDEIKDVGGYVGGTFINGRRKPNALIGRDLICLDFDTIEPGKADEVIKKVNTLGCAFVIHSTRKHAPYAPRLRVVIPTDRTMSPDEYEPVARKLAEQIGLHYADPTTFDTNRLMYYPSCSVDGEYIFEVGDKPFVSVEGVLGLYEDWHDHSEWPRVPGHDLKANRAEKQEDPTGKKGIVGAFCKAYNIYEAMETFLSGVYAEATDNRYTYTGGSTAGGAVVYGEGLFLYSHHATDPASGVLCNAFDLVRLHKYHDLDDDIKEGTPANRLPSYLKMKEIAIADPQVSGLMAKEKAEKALEAFDSAESTEWTKELQVNQNGNLEKTIDNTVLVLLNDPLLAGKIALDEFANRGLVIGALPWDTRTDKRFWTDVDDAEIARYLERFYGLTGQDRIDKALTIVSFTNRFNDVKEYLESVTWDGKKRLERLFIDFLGAEDNEYVRTCTKKAFTAAVYRAVGGATKFDYMIILTGKQGIGKSTLLGLMGGEWFSDSLQTFEGKEAAEMIQGTWINEVGELTGMSKSEENAVKQFLSKKEDIYREAYGRRTNKYARRCIFFGTSNDNEFLKDTTGNRRFWPIEVGVNPASKNVWKELRFEVPQLWAEAYVYWQLGEPLYLPPAIERMAEEQQELHKESNPKEGIILDYLDTKIPENWYDMGLNQKRQYLSGNLHFEGPSIKRDKICAIEVWCEAFYGDPKKLDRRTAAEINGILSGLKGWKRNKSNRRYGGYGVQRGYEKEVVWGVNKVRQQST